MTSKSFVSSIKYMSFLYLYLRCYLYMYLHLYTSGFGCVTTKTVMAGIRVGSNRLGAAYTSQCHSVFVFVFLFVFVFVFAFVFAFVFLLESLSAATGWP